MPDPRATTLSHARADAHTLADAFAKAWALAVYAPARSDVIADLLAEAQVALDRLNAEAAALGLETGQEPHKLAFKIVAKTDQPGAA